MPFCCTSLGEGRGRGGGDHKVLQNEEKDAGSRHSAALPRVGLSWSEGKVPGTCFELAGNSSRTEVFFCSKLSFFFGLDQGVPDKMKHNGFSRAKRTS